MDQERVQAPPEPSGDKPKLFQSVNGVIAGVTGLVVALGGLAAATKDLWSKSEEEPPALTARNNSGAEEAQPQAVAASAEKKAAVRPTAYKGKLYNKESEAYDGATVLLTKEGARWVLTAGDQDWEYDEIVSNDPSLVIAKSTGYASKIRWPVDGGLLKESTSEIDDWEYYADIKPVASSPTN